MLAIYLFVIAVVVGGIASGQNWRLVLLYVPVAFVGALLGAFISFGDAPLLLRYPILNQFTLSLLGSIALVLCSWIWRHRRTTNR